MNSGCGECDKKKRAIHLDAKLAGDELTKVLLHEMAHAAVPRKGHGKAWLAEMKRLADMGAPTREDWETYQDAKRTITNKDIVAEAFDMGTESPTPWGEARRHIGVKYGLTDVQGKPLSKTAEKLIEKLRQEFYKGRECGWPNPPE